jgi:hypothetical protein
MPVFLAIRKTGIIKRLPNASLVKRIKYSVYPFIQTLPSLLVPFLSHFLYRLCVGQISCLLKDTRVSVDFLDD